MDGDPADVVDRLTNAVKALKLPFIPYVYERTISEYTPVPLTLTIFGKQITVRLDHQRTRKGKSLSKISTLVMHDQDEINRLTKHDPKKVLTIRQRNLLLESKKRDTLDNRVKRKLD